MKLCNLCNKIKDDFYKVPNNICISCCRKRDKEWYANNKTERKKYNLEAYYKRQYNFTLKERDAFFKSHNNKCNICNIKVKKNVNLAINQGVIDHCHETKMVRGLLCNQCNKALGCFKDDITAMKSAIKYMEKSCQSWSKLRKTKNTTKSNLVIPI